jgi:hypothetical protein
MFGVNAVASLSKISLIFKNIGQKTIWASLYVLTTMYKGATSVGVSSPHDMGQRR